MDNTSIKPQNLPEKLVWYYIVGTFIAYYLGSQFVATPLLAFFLVFYLIKKWWNQTDETPESERIAISLTVWIWIFAMLTIEMCIIVSHINYDLGLVQIIRTSVGWARQWGLFALFPLAGHLRIRPQIIYRAVCILSLQCVIVVVLDNLVSLFHLPVLSFTSPLKVLGGGNALYTVKFFNNSIAQRNDFQLFAGWPTILGLISVIYFHFACQDLDKRWRRIGIWSYTFLVFASQSRVAILSFAITLFVSKVLTNWFRPKALFITGLIASLSGIALPKAVDLLLAVKNFFDNYRGKDSADSGQLRSYINRMTLARWQSESPIWGHGVIEEFGNGPRITYGIPLGTHSTWFAILYNHGVVGFFALALAFLCSFLTLTISSQSSELSRMGLTIIIVLVIFGFSEPLQVWAYIYWAPLLILGMALNKSP